jgi:intracellular sulfur oxidation DsrE/DsrF family protein
MITARLGLTYTMKKTQTVTIMNNDESSPAGRRSLLSGLGVAALAGVALGSTTARAQQKPGRFEPKRHAEDAWMDTLPGDHRVFIDTDSAAGSANALRYATNILNAQVGAYKGADRDMAIIVCLRHASTTLGFNDAMWAKYGSSLGAMGRPPAREPGAEAPPAPSKNSQTNAIAAAAARGVQFAICDTATTLISGMIARQAGLKAEDVHAELVANTVPNAHMVPAGVMALTRAQEYGYSFLYSAA